MTHLDEGTLRRLHDEPFIITDAQRRHLDRCERCRERRIAVEENARSAERLFALSAPSFEAGPALPRARASIAGQPAPWQRRLSALLYNYRDRALKPAAGLAAALALVSALAFTPAGSLAQSFITIFQPQQIATVPVTTSELQSLPNLRKFGTLHQGTKVQPRPVANAAAAASASGMQILVPSSLPASVPSTPTYEVVSGNTSTFTFSAAKAQQWAAKKGKTLPPMPARINGSTLQLTTYPAVAAVYGGNGNNIPALLVGQMPAPKISSTGVTVKELEDYILSLPGVDPQLAAAIRALGDPTSTLPLPIPVNVAHADRVTVQGASGYAVGDSTGMGSAVIWEKGGIIYGVGGPLTESQVIDVANSLH